MPGSSRSLPGRPNLRYLRLEAKRQASQAEPLPGPGQRPACGLGWLISPRGDMAAHAGGGLDGTATLAIRICDNRTHLVQTSRLIPVNSIDVALRGAWTNPEE